MRRRRGNCSKYRLHSIIIILILNCIALSGCTVKEDVEPKYVFNLKVSVDNGVLSDFIIILPLPTRNNETFYGINELVVHYNTTEEELGWKMEIMETEYGNMLGIIGLRLDESNEVSFGHPFYPGRKINAKDPLTNEYLFTPKLNMTEESGKINHEILLAAYQTKIYLNYNASDSTIITVFYAFTGNYPGAPPKGYSYRDTLDQSNFAGPKDGWFSVRGNISRRNLNE